MLAAASAGLARLAAASWLTETDEQQPCSGDTKAALDDESAPPRCRLCLSEADAGPDGALLSPGCKCKGSVAHVHLKCLQTWQQTLWAQGLFSRALTCDICRAAYGDALARFPRAPPPPNSAWAGSGARERGGSGGGPRPLRERAAGLLLRLARSPDLALRLWRACVLLGGTAAGMRQGLTGLGVGLALGLRLARPVLGCVLQAAPEVGLLAAALPATKPALRVALCVGGAALVAEVAIVSAAGLVCGGALGFARGSVGVVAMTVDACRLLSLLALGLCGARRAGLLGEGAGALALRGAVRSALAAWGLRRTRQR